MKKVIILIADDNVDNCLLIKAMLESNDYDFIYAYNGVEAIEKVRTNDVDLVLLDLKMPKMNGIEAALKIREIKPGIKIILQTAYARELKNDKLFHYIVDEIIKKPISHFHLQHIVSKVLKGKLVYHSA